MLNLVSYYREIGAAFLFIVCLTLYAECLYLKSMREKCEQKNLTLQSSIDIQNKAILHQIEIGKQLQERMLVAQEEIASSKVESDKQLIELQSQEVPKQCERAAAWAISQFK